MKKPLFVTLETVERIEITSIVDNYVDVLLPSTDIVERPPLSKIKELPMDTLVAEHGLSLLVETGVGTEQNTILLDTGYNANSAIHNLDQLEVDIQAIETIVLSHAHMDHTGALLPILDRMSHPISLVVHPHVFTSSRYLETKDAKRLWFPNTVAKESIPGAKADLVESKTPTLIANNTIMVTGEVERTISFEKGMPNVYLDKDGISEKDHIWDDQSLVLHLKDKGLVLIGGCCHAGIVNTIRYARKLTGVKEVYAVFGGFHLTGPIFEPIIDKTIDALKEIDPEIIVPMHCTGWHATHKLADAFPGKFILNSVGSKYHLT